MNRTTYFTQDELLQMLEGKEVIYQGEKMKHIYTMEKENAKKPGEKKLILVNMNHSYYVRDSLRNNNIPFFQCITNSLTCIETEKCTIQFVRDDMKYVRGYRPDAAFCFSLEAKEYLLTPNVIVFDYITDLIPYVNSIENGTADKELAKSFELMREGLITVKEFTELFPEFANPNIIVIDDIMDLIDYGNSIKNGTESEKPTPLTKKETKELFKGIKTPNQIRAKHGLPPVDKTSEESTSKKLELSLSDGHNTVKLQVKVVEE